MRADVDLAPPAAIDAEQALLGTLLYENEAFELCEGLTPETFYEPVHARMFDLMVKLRRKQRLADLVTVAEQMAGDPGFDELGGIRYLADLVDKAPPAPNAPQYARLVLEAAMRRALVKLAEEAIVEARDPGNDAFELVAAVDRAITAMVHDAAPDTTNLIDARSSALATIQELEQEAREGRAKGAMTGLRCFDRRMRGLRPGWLVVVAGRPSMGKTALARAAALGCARKNPSKQVVFFALEMARRELDERTLSQLSFETGDGIPYKDMNGDLLHVEDRIRLGELVEKVPSNFIIDDSPILSVSYVRRRVLSLKRKAPIAAVFIDYLQIMDRPDAKGRNEASVIGEMTKQLKQLAREAQTCVVLLSQINRGVESRDDKRPHLADLRESGAIEQDANAVFFPYREVYYTERAKPKDAGKEEAWLLTCEEQRRVMEVIAAKVRQGAIGTDTQLYFAEFDAIMDRPEDQR